MPPRPDLAALLVEHKVAGVRVVDRVVRGRGEVAVWRALVEGAVATDEQIFSLLRDNAKFPVATQKVLLGAPPSIEALTRLLPKERALALGILPFEIEADGTRAQIAMIDPTDEPTLRELARTGSLKQAKVYIAERAALVSAIERAYSGRARKETNRNTVEPAAKLGQRSDAESADRLERMLVQAALALGTVLEIELSRGNARHNGNTAREAARLAREVARELGYDRRKVALAGISALLVQLDVVHRSRRGDEEQSLFELVSAELGWAGGGEDGLLGIARSLAAASAGYGRQQPGGPLERIVQAVADFLALGGPDGEAIDLEAAEQLLRASSAGSNVVDALTRILRRDLAERTPAVATRMPEAQAGTDGGEGLTTVRSSPRGHESVSQRQQINAEDRTQLVSIAGVVPPTDSPLEES